MEFLEIINYLPKPFKCRFVSMHMWKTLISVIDNLDLLCKDFNNGIFLTHKEWGLLLFQESNAFECSVLSSRRMQVIGPLS